MMEQVTISLTDLQKRIAPKAAYYFTIICFVAFIISILIPGMRKELFPAPFLVCFLYFGYQTLQQRKHKIDINAPIIVINNQGIFDRRLGIGVIPWEEINGSELVIERRIQCIALQLHQPDMWIQKLPRSSQLELKVLQTYRGLKFDEIYINIGALPCNPWNIHKIIEDRIDEIRHATD
jgi:hypothetical protein